MDLWNAKKKRNSSWSWLSLMEGISFLKNHSRFMVGNGACIYVVNDTWNSNGSKVVPRVDLWSETKVVELLLPKSKLL